MAAASIVRREEVRQSFAKVLWIPLGQTPSLEVSLQDAKQQLTGTGFNNPGLTIDQMKQQLAAAMQTERVLLVLDDCW